MIQQKLTAFTMGEPPTPCPSLQRLPIVFGVSPQWTFNPLRLPFSRVALNLWEQKKELAAITSIGRKTRRGWSSCLGLRAPQQGMVGFGAPCGGQTVGLRQAGPSEG